MTDNTTDPRRNLPSVSALIEFPKVVSLVQEFSRAFVLEAINDSLEAYRQGIKPGDDAPDVEQVADDVEARLVREEHERLRPVVNATGILLHTGLGRAVLPQAATEALGQLDGCCNLQIDLESGKRGKRNYMTEKLLCKLTGAESALVVNNNAAATLLILRALCSDKEVIVSRGQLIEIGGSFRLPDCIHQSGAYLVEVGTTNKTHLRDYEGALSEDTGAIMLVNPSNYRMVGFTKSVAISEVCELKKKRPDVAIIDDLGCGALVDLTQYGLPHEPTVQDSVTSGADVVCFSGDKLISGPQAGIIVGKKEYVEKIRKHPLTRMLRVCKLTDIALENTLLLFLDPDKLAENNPTLRMLTLEPAVLKRRAKSLKRRLEKDSESFQVRVVEAESAMGGGSLPGVSIPTYALAISSEGLPPERLGHLLRQNEPPIIARIKDDELLLDMRTLLDGDDDEIVEALSGIASS